MSDNWDSYFCRIEDKPASISVDFDIAKLAPLEALPFSTYIRLYMNAPRESGLSSDAEFETLKTIEDHLQTELTGDGTTLYVGQVTSDGCRDFFYYRSVDEEWDSRAKSAMQSFAAYEFDTGSREDREWQTYFEFLFPSQMDFQHIINQRICAALERNGDVLAQPREIEHFAHFPSEVSRRSFMEGAQELGFQVRAATEAEDESNPYGIQLVRVDAPAYSTIDEVTLPLFNLANEQGGIYDGWEAPGGGENVMVDLSENTDYDRMRADFQLEIPEFYNFGFDEIERRATEADKTAFIYVARDGETIEHHSFSDLNRAANRFANVLLGLGAEQGDFAFVMIPRLPAWYQVMIGCIKTGVVAMPGTNLLMPKDIEYRINKSQAKLAIVTADAAGKIEDIRANCRSLEHLIVIGGERDGWTGYEAACAAASDQLSRDDVPHTRADDMMLVYFTSGTTAFPKMVPRDHGYALAHAITGRYWMDLREDDIHWTLSDTGWAKAAWGMLFPPWLMGATNVLYDADLRFDADVHLKLVERLGVTTFCAPPTVYRVFAQADLASYDLSSIRHSISAGEPLNPEVMRVWKDVTGTDVYDGYGQTETINIVANIPGLEIRPGSMGRPVPGVEVDVIDDQGQIVADGEVGHIGVRLTEPHPPGLFTGYYGDDAANTECFHDGWYFSGDTATRDGDGYIWFVGRSDDIISSAGYRISPFEVESTLQEHPAVAESAVVAKPDALRGSIVKAFVIPAPGHEPSPELEKDIQDFVKSHTAPYKYPREIEFRESLPKTVSGKIRRVELRAEAEVEGEG